MNSWPNLVRLGSVSARRLSQPTCRLSLILSSRQRLWFSSYPPYVVVGLPSLSPTMESGSIASWNVKEGTAFGAGDILCSVETDKATVEFEAQDEGVVAKILVDAGPNELKVGSPILVTVESEDHVGAFASFTLASATTQAADSTPTPSPAAAPTPAVAPSPTAATTSSVPDLASSPAPSGGRVVASPLAHMLAKELAYDLSAIRGTGPGGRIVAADVKEYVPSAPAPTASVAAPVTAAFPALAQAVLAAAPPVVGSGYTDYPLSESAKEAASRLAQSKRNVPHYYLTVDIAVDELLALRSKLNANLGDDAKIGVYEIMLKAAAMSMKAVPSVNASWMEDVVRVYDSVDINVVIGAGDSLYTPVLRDCSSKGLKDIGKELKSAVDALDSDSPALLGGVGTFTVMNLGMYGIKSCAPIIREPQSCVLALGALENRIVPSDDPETLYKESVMLTATLSCDHRVVDGAVGAQWLAAFKSHVENPSTLLL